MRRLRLILTCVLPTLLSVLPAQAQDNGLHVQPVVLMHSDMAALRGLVPAGWQSQGGLTWGDPCVPYGYNINWQAQSPDSSYGMAFVPSLGWGQGEYSNCRQTPLASIEDVLMAQAKAMWPGVKMIDFRRRPDIVGGLAVPADIPSLSFSAPGMGMRAWLDAGEAMFSFSKGQGGPEMRGVIMASGIFAQTHLDPSASGLQIDPSLFPGLQLPAPPPAQTFLAGGTEWGFAAWAPSGGLDLVAFEALRKSFVPTGEWSDFIMKHRAVIDGQNAKGAADRAEIRRQTNAEIAGIIMAGYDERMAINDRSHREYMETVRGVETYVNLSGQPVQLDYNYKNAWQLADGSYFLTNDPSFDPYTAFNMDGRQLQAAP